MLCVIPPPLFAPQRRYVPTELEVERRHRIRVTLWAYAYEIENVSLVSDEEYDRVSRLIDPRVPTGHAVLDAFFATKFDPSTGMWIYQHPELNRVRALYARSMKRRLNYNGNAQS